MPLPEKDYFHPPELAESWRCTLQDIWHYVLQGKLYGLDGELNTIGIYSVTGVLLVPTHGVAAWEHGDRAPYLVSGFVVAPTYRPAITEASYLDEAEFPPPIMPWKSGHSWDNPELDYSRLERFMDGRDRHRLIHCEEVVVHAVERKRFERKYGVESPEGLRAATKEGAREIASVSPSDPLLNSTAQIRQESYGFFARGDYWEVHYGTDRFLLKYIKVGQQFSFWRIHPVSGCGGAGSKLCSMNCIKAPQLSKHRYRLK
jgi:hypothetical protein